MSQPEPVKNSKPYIIDAVVSDLLARAEAGEKKYGTKLQPFNGRDALTDAYEEALDMCQYLRQAIEERDASVDEDVIGGIVITADDDGDAVFEICGATEQDKLDALTIIIGGIVDSVGPYIGDVEEAARVILEEAKESEPVLEAKESEPVLESGLEIARNEALDELRAAAQAYDAAQRRYAELLTSVSDVASVADATGDSGVCWCEACLEIRSSE